MLGNNLSHYEILDELGRGGMGIVFKAEDTKLGRVVAVKVLPASALLSEDDRARFYREAKSAAQLHHPHIASVFEIDEVAIEGDADAGLRPFIAMEFVDGESLQKRIQSGPMRLEEAVRLATQIASALEAAHDKDIVHRDIKAANVMLTSKGDAKVLDFGLAKTTQSTLLTRMGSTVGTAAYMSPEQARGDDVDHRSDLWSLGVLLYEMIAGRLPFRGDYEQAVTYSILNEEPEPLTAVRTGVPMGLEWIVAKLLAKKCDDRYQTAKDLIVDLRTVDLDTAGLSRVSKAASAVSTPDRVGGRRQIPAVAWAGVGALAVTLLWLLFPTSKDSRQSMSTQKHIVQTLPAVNGARAIDISGRGDKVALAGDAVQVLDLQTGRTTNFEVGGDVVHVDFSADGTELLLTKSAGIDRMSLATGSVVNVVDTREGGPRAEWRNDDFVVYEERQTIYGVSLTSSQTRKIITVDSLRGEYDMDYPHVLPDGNTLIATAEYRDGPSRIGFWDIDSGRNLGYLDYPGYRVQWLKEGYLVFSMESSAMALPFDPKSLKQVGPIVPIQPFVRPQGLSISNEGTLISVSADYRPIGSTTPISPTVYRQIASSGEVTSPPGRFPAAVYANAAINPSGDKAAVAVREFDDGAWNSDIWVLDFVTGSRRALTRDGISDYPAWNPAGDSIYFVRYGVNDKIAVMSSSGRGRVRTIPTRPVPTEVDLAVSPSGEWAVTAFSPISNLQGPVERNLPMRIKLWNLQTEEYFFIDTPNGSPRHLDFSPSGRHLVFEDQGAVFVLPMSDVESTPYPVWESSMMLPRWAADESKLYARHDTRFFVSIDVQTSPTFATVGDTEELFPQGDRTLLANIFDVFPNTEHFEFLTGTSDPDGSTAASDSAESAVELHFILNLPAQLAK